MAKSQDRAPTKRPSITKTPTMAREVAPMARMTPISRVRSTTLLSAARSGTSKSPSMPRNSMKSLNSPPSPLAPASARMNWPVMQRARSEHRNTAAPTSSSTSPQRPAGVRAASHVVNAGSETRSAVSSVAKYPGASALTFTPSG